ncbi:MAG: DUF5700 domain-containing putative Zn-dependent protease [Candidatus Heimdallarchaeaceae archaeon]
MRIDLDLTSFQKFWELMFKLEEHKAVTDEDWNELFDTPGFKALIDNEYNEEFFKQNFLLVFDPNNGEILHQKLANEKNRVLLHLLEIKSKRELLQAKVKYLEQNWKKISDTLLTRCQAFLPNVEFETIPVVSIVIFDIDAQSYETIVVDTIFVQELESFVSLTAHELFHFYRKQMLCYDEEKVEESDKDLLWILNQIHSEGVADHIDKDYFIYGGIKTPFPDPYVNFFKKSVVDSPRIISSINSIVDTLDSSTEKFLEVGKEIKKLVPLAGHTLGYYMVNLILKNSLYKELVKVTGDPFSFFKLYNKAVLADKENLPLFSTKFIELISKIKEKYHC